VWYVARELKLCDEAPPYMSDVSRDLAFGSRGWLLFVAGVSRLGRPLSLAPCWRCGGALCVVLRLLARLLCDAWREDAGVVWRMVAGGVVRRAAAWSAMASGCLEKQQPMLMVVRCV